MGIIHVVGEGSHMLANSSWSSAAGFYDGRTRSFSNSTFGSILDGTSNTALLTERHIFEASDVARTRRSTMWGLTYAAFVSTMATNARATLAGHRWNDCVAGTAGLTAPGVTTNVDTTQTCYSSIGANHTGGVNMALGDGAVRFQTETVDLNVWCTLGAMADRDKVELP